MSIIMKLKMVTKIVITISLPNYIIFNIQKYIVFLQG